MKTPHAILLAIVFFLASFKAPLLSQPVQRDRGMVIVVCPDELQPALEDWIGFRQGQGYRIAVIEPHADAPATADRIRSLFSRSGDPGPAAVLMIGKPKAGKASCPTFFVESRVTKDYSESPFIPTDIPYGDLDGDELPDVPIGRIPVESPVVLKRILDRVEDYETQSAPGIWRHKFNMIAGVGNFGPMIDAVIESTAKGMICKMIPAGFDVSMTLGNWTSPYCPAPHRFCETAIGKFNEGCLFWIYIGHAGTDRLAGVESPDGYYPILDTHSATALNAEGRSPIAVMLCCLSAAFDSELPCLAEAMISQKNGAVAVIGGSNSTMPYGMGRISIEMMDRIFRDRQVTLGELLMQAKLDALKPVDDEEDFSNMRNVIRGAGLAMSPRPELLEAEIVDHLYLMQLIGDPLTLVRLPEQIPLQVSRRMGGEVVLKGQSPFEGRMIVEICYSRGRFLNRPKKRDERTYFRSPDILHEEYLRLQNTVCCREEIEVIAGDFEVAIPVPNSARGSIVVRSLLERDNRFAMGDATLELDNLHHSGESAVVER